MAEAIISVSRVPDSRMFAKKNFYQNSANILPAGETRWEMRLKIKFFKTTTSATVPMQENGENEIILIDN